LNQFSANAVEVSGLLNPICLAPDSIHAAPATSDIRAYDYFL